MSTVTSEEVWEAHLRDSEFADQPQEMLSALRPYIEMLPTILADKLDEPVTLSSVMQAKLAFLQHCLDNDFVSVAVSAMPYEDLGFFERDHVAVMLTGALEDALSIAQNLSEHLSEFLNEAGVTEQEVMLSEKIGFTDETRKRYESGNLTINDLLKLQPGVISKNT